MVISFSLKQPKISEFQRISEMSKSSEIMKKVSNKQTLVIK